jgi:UDP-N-acetylglucosamine--N-acetylmuramyl-(pentapeptide) pyrophosphoryl-undecaprenol N-acetylglucosamine transferase
LNHLLCTGGGTAGHVLPTLPVIERVLAQGGRVSYVGSRSGLEQQLLQGVALSYFGISSGKLRRYFAWANVTDLFRILAGICQALVLLRRLRPDVVFSKGGFVSFPVVLAAWLLRIPSVAHESDISPGLANRLAMPFLDTLCVNFDAARADGFRGRRLLTGTPLRGDLLHGDRDRGRRLLGVAAARPVLLVTGGSLGADAINEVVRAALPDLLARFEVVHVCGPGKAVALQRERYHQFEYVTQEWGDLLAAADLVVSRAGANTLYELLALGKPSLLIPLSRRVSRGDQIENAAYAEARGFAHVLAEEDLSPAALLEAISGAWRELPFIRERLAGFQPLDSTTLILDALETACRSAPLTP